MRCIERKRISNNKGITAVQQMATHFLSHPKQDSITRTINRHVKVVMLHLSYYALVNQDFETQNKIAKQNFEVRRMSIEP